MSRKITAIALTLGGKSYILVQVIKLQVNNSFKKGLIAGIPIGIGYFSVSFAFGIMAIKYGLSPLEALLISMTNLTSAGQLAGAPIIASGGSFVELAMTQLVINSRYALMSVSLSQKLNNAGFWSRLLIAFANTDEIFAVSVSQKGSVGKRFFYGLMILPLIGWNLGTITGAVAGAGLPTIITDSLSVAIYAMLIAIVIPKAKAHLPTALCALIAAALSCGFKYLPVLTDFAKDYAGFVIIICAVVASLVAAILFPVNTEEEVVRNDD